MKKKDIFKGLLLWITVFSILLFIMATDSLSLVAVISWMAINAALIVATHNSLTVRDIYHLSGYRLMYKTLK